MNLIRGNLHISEHASCVLTEEGFELPIQNISSHARQAQSVIYGVRPEHLRIVEQAGLEARVLVIEPTGTETHVAARLGNSDILISQRERFCLNIGSPIRILPIIEQAHLFDADTGQRLN